MQEFDRFADIAVARFDLVAWTASAGDLAVGIAKLVKLAAEVK